MAKIYTRTGDEGETSLLGGRRVRKDDARIEAIGSIDEVNAAIGLVRVELARSGVAPVELDRELGTIQHRLFDLGAELASPVSDTMRVGAIGGDDAKQLEESIDGHEEKLEPLRQFILPGGAPAAAQLHLARCICRRCERRLVELASSETLRPKALQYINRLSDWLFVAARLVNQSNRVPDVTWEHRPVSDAGSATAD